MPRLKSAESLKDLCLKNVMKYMDTIWCVDYRDNYVEKYRERFSFIEGPFNSLDSNCIKGVMDQLSSKKRMTKLYLHLLIVPNLKQIDLSGSPKLINDEIVDLICIRCRDVTKLQMDHCSRVSPGALIKLVRSFHKTLIEISIAGTKVTDSVLETIGTCCENLRILCIDMCKTFSLEGIMQLIYADRKKTLTRVGQNIQALRISGCSFDDQIDFICDILKRCSSLRCVTHFQFWDCVVKLCEENSNPPALKFTGVRYDNPIRLWPLRNHHDAISLIPRCVPEIQHLSINDIEGMDMHLFNLLSGCGKTLRSLNLDWYFPYEFFQYIGLLCPDLDTFMVHAPEAPSNPSEYREVKRAFDNYISTNNLSKNKHPWKRLRQLCIYWPTEVSPPSVPSVSPVLLDIFKNAAATLVFIRFHFMSDSDLDSLLLNALESKYFENLETLDLDESLSLTSEPVWDLITTAPKLKKFSFCGCRQIDLSEFCDILDFVRENNYDVEIDEDYR